MKRIETASELVQMMLEYDCYKTSPSDMSVIFGCDCGCGGDSYSDDEWDEAHEQSDRVKGELRDFCDQVGLDWDLD